MCVLSARSLRERELSPDSVWLPIQTDAYKLALRFLMINGLLPGQNPVLLTVAGKLAVMAPGLGRVAPSKSLGCRSTMFRFWVMLYSCAGYT